MTNWLSQIGVLSLFNLRTIAQRKGSALSASVGIAGVVIVLVGVLSIAEGFRAAMSVSGSDDVVSGAEQAVRESRRRSVGMGRG